MTKDVDALAEAQLAVECAKAADHALFAVVAPLLATLVRKGVIHRYELGEIRTSAEITIATTLRAAKAEGENPFYAETAKQTVEFLFDSVQARLDAS